MRVAVTGAAGLLGRSITRYLVERGLELRAIVRSEAQGRALKVDRLVSIVTADILSTPRLVSAFMGCDAVVHCAARVQLGGLAREFYVANVLGTKAVLEACREARVPRLVHISSQGVYDLDDARDGELIDETSATESRPERRGAYSRTKLAAEHLLRRMSSTSPTPHVVILRPGAYLVRIVKGGKPMLRFAPTYVRVPTGAAIRLVTPGGSSPETRRTRQCPSTARTSGERSSMASQA